MTKSIIVENRPYKVWSCRSNRTTETDHPPNTACDHCQLPMYRDRHAKGFRTFCSWSCRFAFYNGKRQRKVIEDKVCGHCGETFTAKRTDARYCSARCRQAARRSRHAG